MAVDGLTISSSGVAARWRPAVTPLIVVTITAAAFAAVIWHVGGEPAVRAYPLWLDLAIAGAFVAAGLAARQTAQPGNMWWLLVLTGWTWLPQVLAPSQDSWVFTFALVGVVLWVGPLAQTVLSYPDGRLQGPVAVAAVALAWFYGSAMRVLMTMFAVRRDTLDIPENHFKVAGVHPAFDWVEPVSESLPPVISLLALAALLMRWRRWGPGQRIRFAPALGLGVLLFTIEFVIAVRIRLGDAVGEWPRVEQLVIALLAVAFLAAYGSDLMARYTAGRLAVQVGVHGDDLQTAIAGALRDPHAQVVALHDDDPLPEPGSSMRVITLTAAHRRVGALVVDNRIDHDPALLASAQNLAALVLDRERLAAEVEERLAEVEASRSRIALAADAERQRIERNLHDGAQQRLIGVTIQMARARDAATAADAELAASLATAVDDVRAALEEIRELARGLHPTVLADMGLAPAVRELAMRASIPTTVDADGLDEADIPVPTRAVAYYVISEGLANAIRHSGAGQVRVGLASTPKALDVEVADDGHGGAALEHGTGLLGLSDRVAAAGGTLVLDSRPGTGTSLRASLPLGNGE